MQLAAQDVISLLEEARGKRIVVIGDAMLDVYLTGDVDRISPEAPVPVVRVRERKSALGGAANVAQNVVALGALCELVAVAGDDLAGRTLRGLSDELSVGTSGLLTVDRRTTVKTRVVARSQQLVRVDEEEDHALAREDLGRLKEAIAVAIDRAHAVVLEDYDKGVLSRVVIRHALECASARQLPVVVDPKYRNFFEYGGATVFKPNLRELESAFGATVNIAEPTALPGMVRRLGVEFLLLTLGERGMALFSADGEVARIPTQARAVYDVVGAGDTVTAYLASMLASGATAQQAAVIANVAAGIEVGKLGAATVTAAEVITHLETHALQY